MICKIILRCCNDQKEVEIPTYDIKDKNTNFEYIISENKLIYEDEWYTGYIKLQCNKEIYTEIKEIKIFLNKKYIGKCVLDRFIYSEQGYIIPLSFLSNDLYIDKAQVFLLQCDLIQLSVQIDGYDDCTECKISNYYICIGGKDINDSANSDNIKAIIDELYFLDDDELNKWVFSKNEAKMLNGSITEGSWRENSFKSLNSYIQMVEKIYICYKKNISLFNSKKMYKITKNSHICEYNKLKNFTCNDIDWLFKNMEQMSIVNFDTAIKYNGKNYLPIELKTEFVENNFNIYENKVVLSFLKYVLKKSLELEKHLKKEIDVENNLIENFNIIDQQNFSAPIITIKQYQTKKYKISYEYMTKLNKELSATFNLYSNILKCDVMENFKQPKNTKIFNEVRHYSEIYNLIVLWNKFGEFDLDKEDVFINIKTADKLFEYYSLIKIIQMFQKHGFRFNYLKYKNKFYKYKVADKRYIIDYDIANTYNMINKEFNLTIYYQPVIYSNDIQNEITLYRTTDKKNYFIPDFIIKIWKGTEKKCIYAILDSKYSSRSNILMHYFEHEIFRYGCQITDINNSNNICLLWMLQGRIGNNEGNIYRYQNSPLAKQHKPFPSYAIISLNSQNTEITDLWDELEYMIKMLL